MMKGGHIYLILSLLLILGFLGCISQKEATTSSNEPPLNDVTKEGKAIILKNGCRGCHTIDGVEGKGPSWKGLYGSQVTLRGGEAITADEAYLSESIKRPNKKIVDGYLAGTMPQDFGEKLVEEDVNKIIEYIKAIK